MPRLVILLLLSYIVASLQSTPPQEEEGVLVLTDANFDDAVNGEDTILVEFYAPWCGHCKKLTPEYSAAAYELRHAATPVKLAKVDCTVEKELGSRFEIKGFPTLKIFRRGEPSPYGGPRDKQGIIDYMLKQAGPAAKSLSTSELVKEFLTHPDVSIIGYGLAGKAAENFKNVAGVLRENFRFGEVTDAELHKDKHGKIVLHTNDKDQPEHVFDAEHDEQSLTDWLWAKSVPLVGELTKTTEGRYKKKGVPLLKLFMDVDHTTNVKQTNYWINRLKKVAKDLAATAGEKLHLTYVNKKDYAAELAKFGSEGKDLVLAIEDFANRRYVSAAEKIDLDSIRKFALEYLEGNLTPFIKSAPVPESNDGPVTVVVGKTFNDIVLDESKDVLLEIYAPWCGHCKKLEPIYDELATKLKNVENVVIAKMDATANDSPHAKYSASGYPTILFAPANDKENPVPYTGERDLQSMEAFIKRKSTSWVLKKTEL